MSAWIDIVEQPSLSLDTPFSWKEYIHTFTKTIAIALVAMAISTFVMVVLKLHWQAYPQSPGNVSMWKLCSAFAGSGMAVTVVSRVFRGSNTGPSPNRYVESTSCLPSPFHKLERTDVFISRDLVEPANHLAVLLSSNRAFYRTILAGIKWSLCWQS